MNAIENREFRRQKSEASSEDFWLLSSGFLLVAWAFICADGRPNLFLTSLKGGGAEPE
jgi:hypothetical protein